MTDATPLPKVQADEKFMNEMEREDPILAQGWYAFLITWEQRQVSQKKRDNGDAKLTIMWKLGCHALKDDTDPDSGDRSARVNYWLCTPFLHPDLPTPKTSDEEGIVKKRQRTMRNNMVRDLSAFIGRKQFPIVNGTKVWDDPKSNDYREVSEAEASRIRKETIRAAIAFAEERYSKDADDDTDPTFRNCMFYGRVEHNGGMVNLAEVHDQLPDDALLKPVDEWYVIPDAPEEEIEEVVEEPKKKAKKKASKKGKK